jgi:hypothetical protein
MAALEHLKVGGGGGGGGRGGGGFLLRTVLLVMVSSLPSTSPMHSPSCLPPMPSSLLRMLTRIAPLSSWTAAMLIISTFTSKSRCTKPLSREQQSVTWPSAHAITPAGRLYNRHAPAVCVLNISDITCFLNFCLRSPLAFFIVIVLANC